MCLAVPGLVKEKIDEKNAIVDFMGVSKKIAMDLIKTVAVGDYVIVHAGFAINILDKEEALEIFRYLE